MSEERNVSLLFVDRTERRVVKGAMPSSVREVVNSGAGSWLASIQKLSASMFELSKWVRSS